MDFGSLSLDYWDSLSLRQAETLVSQLSLELPEGFDLKSLTSHTYGGQQRNTAIFEYNKVPFALVPGGEVLVGYDWNRHINLAKTDQEDWQETSEEYGLGPFEEFLKKCTTPLRKIAVKPCLAEVRATLLGIGFPVYRYSKKIAGLPYWTTMAAKNFRIRSKSDSDTNDLRILPGKVTLKVHRENQVEYFERPSNHLEIVEEINQSGFRVPTTDEWEYLCGAGSATLFRWGDYFPDFDIYNQNNSDQFIEDSGNLIQGPNAFGLHFVSNTYDVEVCENGFWKGGDGGSSVCGGIGRVATWLTLATAYYDSSQDIERNKHYWESNLGQDISFFRRMFPL